MPELHPWEDEMATLYLTEAHASVHKDGDTLKVFIPEEKGTNTPKRTVTIPLIKVTQVVVYGDVTLTSPAMMALLDQGVDICFCSYYGQFKGRLAPPFGKNSLIRLQQHAAHNDPARSLLLAKTFVKGKLVNMRAMLMRANRKRGEEAIGAAVETLKGVIEKVEKLDAAGASVPDPAHPQSESRYGALLGLEGAGAAAYFGVFGSLLPGEWGFERRVRRPPRDPVNALLSYGYVLLMNQVSSAISIVGLDPYVGYLHSSQFGKPALALDVMEAFRPLVVDSTVLTLLNNGMLERKDFVEELGAWSLTEKGRRTFLQKFEERLDTEIVHPVFEYRATYRRCLELEVRLVAKWLTGEIPVLRPFVVR
ncbi:MAG: type I-D CRISPR-associated endonuclease Cas1d [Caldilineales bacterium]|nr:type I-D CRISPR-associated endonuclease Cas1d [Caldilineales bacterium]